MIESDLRVEPYASRRAALLERHPDGPILVRGGDGGSVSASFYYLTGIVEPRAMLLLSGRGMRIGTGAANPGPNYIRGRKVHQALFLPQSDALAEVWGEASDASLDRVGAASVGMDAVLSVSSFATLYGAVLREADRAWVVRARPPQLAQGDDDDARLVRKLRDRFLHLTVGDATATVHELRRIKSEDEVAAVRKAIELVRTALGRVYAKIRPGVTEAELEGELTAAYREGGATHSFDPIVASGSHALQLHYTRNSGRLADGDLLLIDTGAQLDGYCADISRTLPVSGRFTDRQRAVYDAVRGAQQAAFEKACDGAELTELHEAAFASLDAEGLGGAFVHGIGHHLGLETHDVGDVHKPLAPGCVVTVEPGAYLRDESIGIRLEDDILITEYGHENLSRAIPADAAAVEATMQALRTDTQR